MELLLPAHRAQVGESPLWHPLERALYWVDIEGRALHRWSWDTHAHQQWATAERPACLALHPEGGLLAGMDSGVFHLRLPAGQTQAEATCLAPVAHPQDGMRFNDGRCDRQGRFWAGTMVRDMSLAAPVGGLYRFDGRTLATVLPGGLITPNGLAFSADGQHLWFSDSHPQSQQIWQARLNDDGSMGPRQPFVDMRDLPGRPDGAAVDAEGGYWICANDAGWVHRFTPQGRLDRSLRVPVSKPAMCSFGGPDLDCLFITTIRPAQPQGDDLTLAGAVFITRPGVQGLAEPFFQPSLV